MNPNDVIRDQILRYLYDRHMKARGPKAISAKISEIQSEMKKLGYKQAQTTSNLDYLIQKEWIREVVTPRTFTTTRGTTRRTESKTYKISDIGIDKMEGASIYYRTLDQTGVNIVNVKGVTIVGDGNVVNAEFIDLSRFLKELEEGIIASSKLKDEEKLDLLADVGSLQSQIASPRPKRELIKRIWQGIEKVVTAAGFVELAAKISGAIAGLG